MSKEILPSLKLYEFYVLDVKAQVAAFSAAWPKATSASPSSSTSDLTSLSSKDLADTFAIQCLPPNWDQLGARFHAQVDVKAAVSFVASLTGSKPSAESLDAAVKAYTKVLDEINLPRYKQFDEDTKAIIDNTKNRARYTRIDADGPKFGPITAK